MNTENNNYKKVYNKKKIPVLTITVCVIILVVLGYFLVYKNIGKEPIDSDERIYSENVLINSEVISVNPANPYDTPTKYIVIEAKNNNEIDVDYEFKIDFYDKNKKIISTLSETLVAIKSKRETTVYVKVGNIDFVDYKVSVNAEKTDFALATQNDYEVKSSDNGMTYSIELLNNSKVDISVDGCIAFYKNNKIVYVDHFSFYDIEPKVIAREAYTYIDTDNDLDETGQYEGKYTVFNFDDTKIIINSVFIS